MKSMIVGVGMVALAASLGLVACGGDAASTGSTAVKISETNYVTIPPAPVTAAPVTTAADAPGSILVLESEYVLQDGDYPSTVASKFKVDFAEFLSLNGWTLVDQQVPEWPGVGQTVRIPAGATVPGIPPDPTPDPTTTAGGTTASAATTTSTTAAAAPTTTIAGGGDNCATGEYTVAEGDFPSRVAAKFDTTVAKLDAVNASTSGYSSFYVGLVIKIPAKDC